MFQVCVCVCVRYRLPSSSSACFVVVGDVGYSVVAAAVRCVGIL